MTAIRCVVSALVLVTGLALVVNDGTADTKRASKRGGANKARQDNVLVAELQHVHNVLKAADPIYNGHRGRAMSEVNHAIGALEKEMKARGLKPHDKHTQNVPKQVSHTMMAQAGQDLKSIHGQLAGMEKTHHRIAAVKHLDRAVSEIGLGLAHVHKKGR